MCSRFQILISVHYLAVRIASLVFIRFFNFWQYIVYFLLKHLLQHLLLIFVFDAMLDTETRRKVFCGVVLMDYYSLTQSRTQVDVDEKKRLSVTNHAN
jgi:hypothetical protein